VAAPAVIAAGVVVSGAQAETPANLPAKTPEQIIALAAGNKVESLSGTVQQTSDLGLPKLPSGDQQSGGQGQSAGVASLMELLTGSHTAKVYADGPQKARVQVLDQLAERDLVRNGTSVWLYNSARNEATHLQLPAGAGQDGGKAGDKGMNGQVLTPDALAQRFLSMVGPSTQVSSGSAAKVAGRSAYELVLSPKPGTTKANTLISEVSIDVDSATGLPLAVRVQARGQEKPAFSVAYSQLSLAAPAASVFEFTPPAGAKVTQRTLPAPDHAKTESRTSGGKLPAQNRPQVVGDGWDAVVVAKAGVSPSMLTSSPLFAQMTKPVNGGRLLHTSLINVLIMDDGTVLAGSVPVQRLQAVAQDR
jgi:outer membrane lipoprotein-sorting protein